MTEESGSEHSIDRRTALRVTVGGLAALLTAGAGTLLFRRNEVGHTSAPWKSTEVARITHTATLTASTTPTPTSTSTSTPTPRPTSTSLPSPTPTYTPLPTMAGQGPGIKFSYHGDREDPKVAVTIDDLNNVDVVRDGLMPFLAENPDIRVTLFPIGRNILYLNRHIPNLWINLLNAGHDVGFHSLRHDRLANTPAADILQEVLRFNELMGQAIGGSFRVRYGRATYGDYGETNDNFREVAEATGLIWVLWSLSPGQEGYTLEYPEAIRNGDIAIFHDEWNNIERMRWFVNGCRERGLQMVSLSEIWLVGE